MPRLAFEEPKGGPAKREPSKHRKESRRDNVVVVLKAATFAIVIALVGAVVLLTTAGGDEPDASSPSVPEIESSHQPNPTSSTPPAAILAPEVRTQTAEVTAAPPPVSTPPSTAGTPSTVEPPDRGDDSRFVVLGQPCDNRGEIGFTQSYEPVMCGGRQQGQPLVWRRMVR